MEKIAMKCTREEYYTIKDLIGNLTNPSEDDFVTYNYLCNYQDSGPQMFHPSKSRKVYHDFNKDIFLKACGIETPKISIDYNYEKVVSLTRLEIETILGYKIKIVK